MRSPRALIGKISRYGGASVAGGGICMATSSLTAHLPGTSGLIVGPALASLGMIVYGVAKIADSRNRHLPEIIEEAGNADEKIINAKSEARRREESSRMKGDLAAAGLDPAKTSQSERMIKALTLSELLEHNLGKPEFLAFLAALTAEGQPEPAWHDGPDDRPGGGWRRAG